MKIVKNERDPPLFTGKLLIKISKHSEKHNSSYRTTQDLSTDGRMDMMKPVYPPTTSLRGV